MRLSYLHEGLNRQQLQTVADELSIDAQELFNNIVRIDPSLKVAEWLVKQVKFKNIRLPEDGHRVKQVLQDFNSVKPRLEIKDINQYRTIHDLESATEVHLGYEHTSKRKLGLQTNPLKLRGVEVYKKGGPYVIYKISDPESLAKMGEGTKWCTRGSYQDCMADQYIKHNKHVFTVTREGSLFAQYTPDFEQIMDVEDSGFANIPSILANLMRPDDPSPTEAYNYTMSAMNGRWPEAEPTIIQDPRTAYGYARYVIGGRWPEAESTIMQDPKAACNYATGVIKGRWPEAEPTIMQEPVAAYNYAVGVVKGRWPEAEPIILDSGYRVVYAARVIRGRWPEAEPTIMKDPKAACNYATGVIKGRWPEAEPTIIQDPRAACNYATGVIKGRWPEAEPTIIQDPGTAYDYAVGAIKGRWPEAEPIILDSEYWIIYARDAIKGRWPEAESNIKDSETLAIYDAMVPGAA